MPDDRNEARPRAAPGRHRPGNVDRHVGARIRERRTMLGMTQQQLADLLGVTSQQAQKYERGLDRITVGRLHTLAGALGVEVGHFYEGLDGGDAPGSAGTEPSRRMMLGLARDFVAMPDRRQQEALCQLASALANGDGDRGEAEAGGGRSAANGHVQPARARPCLGRTRRRLGDRDRRHC